MIHDKKHLKYTAIPNEEMYWERVNSVSWSQTSKAKLKLKDGRLSFFLDNTL